jgi:hypothetical protein
VGHFAMPYTTVAVTAARNGVVIELHDRKRRSSGDVGSA